MSALPSAAARTWRWNPPGIIGEQQPADGSKPSTLSRASYRKMQQNLAWAAGYNIIALHWLPGFGPFGIILSPSVGALLIVCLHHHLCHQRPVIYAV